MESKARFNAMATLRLPLFAAACSLVTILLLLASGFGTRLGLWQFPFGLKLLQVSGGCGLFCILLALYAAVSSAKKRRFAGVAVALASLFIGAIAFGMPYSWMLKVQSFPHIHDISTDLDNPPKFVALVPFRAGRVEYGGAALASEQLKGYPDLKTVVLPVSKERAYQSALDSARDMGWQIVASVPAEGRIEATDTTFWFGFKDDVVIRVFPAGDRSLLDIRSASRVGISDVGTNAKRIRSFLARISLQVR
jgi:hypothetical protein